jgi:hypothetical protein
MLLAGIQAEFGLDPRLKHSGVTVLGVASLDPSQIFEGEREVTKNLTIYDSKLRCSRKTSRRSWSREIYRGDAEYRREKNFIK